MAPAKRNMKIWAGNTFVFPFVCKDSSGAVIDLTGSKVVFIIKNGSTTVIRWATDDSPANGIEFTDAAAGRVTITMTANETSALPTGGSLRYEIEHWETTSPSSVQTSLLYGACVVTVWVNDNVDP